MKCSICDERSSKLTTINNDHICDRCLSDLMEGESESEDSELEYNNSNLQVALKCSICDERSFKLTTINNDRICDRCMSDLMEGESESEPECNGFNELVPKNTPQGTVVVEENDPVQKDRVEHDQANDHLKTPLEETRLANEVFGHPQDHQRSKDSTKNNVVEKLMNVATDPDIDDHLENNFEDEIKCEESRLAESVPKEDCTSVDEIDKSSKLLDLSDISYETPVIKEEVTDSVVDDHLIIPLENEINCRDTNSQCNEVYSADSEYNDQIVPKNVPTNVEHFEDHQKVNALKNKQYAGVTQTANYTDIRSIKEEVVDPINDDRLEIDSANKTTCEEIQSYEKIMLDSDKINKPDNVRSNLKEGDKCTDEEATNEIDFEVKIKDDITIEEARLALDNHEHLGDRDETTIEHDEVTGSISSTLQDQPIQKLTLDEVKVTDSNNYSAKKRSRDTRQQSKLNNSAKRVSKRLENQKVANSVAVKNRTEENVASKDHVNCEKNVEAQKYTALKKRDRTKVQHTSTTQVQKKSMSKKVNVDHNKPPTKKRTRLEQNKQMIAKTTEDHDDDHSSKPVPNRSRRSDYNQKVKHVEAIEGNDHGSTPPAVEGRSRSDRRQMNPISEEPKRLTRKRKPIEPIESQKTEDVTDHAESFPAERSRRSDQKRSKTKPSKLDDRTKEESSKSTICRLCDFEGVTPRSIRSHMVKRHGMENLNRCQICYQFFKGDKLFENHIRDEHQGLYRICKICLEGYGKGEDEIHATKCPGRKLFECSSCKIKYVNKEAIWKHLTTHEIPDDQKDSSYSEVTIKEAFFTCVVCEDDRAFGEGDHKDHIQQEHKGHHIRCPECRKTFRLRASYICHRRRVCKNNFKDLGTSTAFKPIVSKCPYCGKCYDNRMKLQDHVKKIHEAKTLKCNICGVEKVGHRALRYHKLKIHTEPQHACSLCKKKFHILAHRDRHEALHQTEGKRLCEQCGRVYHDSKALEMHIRVLHHKGLPRYRGPKTQPKGKKIVQAKKKK